MAGQLLRMRDGRTAIKVEATQYNPRPAGVIRQGSATDAVLKVLEANPGRFFTCGDLMARTGRSHAAVSWALIYLRDVVRAVETASDSRQGNYLRYRLRRGK